MINIKPKGRRIMSLKKIFTTMVLITFVFTGVTLANSSTGTTKVSYSVAVHTKPITIGDVDCPTGGILLETGFDVNQNNILDLVEIETSEKIYNAHNETENSTKEER